MTEKAGRTVLVTGATGFIGSRLAARLADDGATVHGVWRRTPPAGDEAIRWHQADLADADASRGLLRAIRPDVVFHLAGHVVGARGLEHVLPAFADNLASTVHLLVAAAELDRQPRMVLAGSLEQPDGDAATAVPSSPYAASKWAADAYVRMFHALYATSAVVARIFMVYGPGQRDLRKLVPYVTLALLRGERPELSSGTREVDWIFVDDVVAGLLALADADVAGVTVDLGSGELVSVRGVVDRLVGLVGGDAAPAFGSLPDRPMEQVRVARADATAERIGWRARVGLDEGLARTVDWYRQHRDA